MEILEQLLDRKVWDAFIQYKTERQHMTEDERQELAGYLREEDFRDMIQRLIAGTYELPVVQRHEINKDGAARKRVVYSYQGAFVWVLKCIAYGLYRYDERFADNCYAFRRNHGVGDAMRRIRMTKGIGNRYCLKVDVHDYFNSISQTELLEKLLFLKDQDAALYTLFEKMLTDPRVRLADGRIVQDLHKGAMAGIPVAAFFANVYLSDVDAYFEQQEVLYFRYSDDILLFAETEEELSKYRELLYEQITAHGLELNPDKVQYTKPGQTWEFLGFCYREGRIDLSEHTKYKIKGKIRRKADALRKWQRKKGLSGDRAAKGFIRAMNRKFFGDGDEDAFTWNRWFFPNLTTVNGLKEIDAYMQQYVRYCVTGRHYKGNYRVRYEQMKQWGYRSLVAEYYRQQNKKEVRRDAGLEN